jgi:hypothetical protein
MHQQQKVKLKLSSPSTSTSHDITGQTARPQSNSRPPQKFASAGPSPNSQSCIKQHFQVGGASNRDTSLPKLMTAAKSARHHITGRPPQCDPDQSSTRPGSRPRPALVTPSAATQHVTKQTKPVLVICHHNNGNY